MADEFPMGICREALWVNPTRSSSLWPGDHMGSFLWSSSDDMFDYMKTTAAAATTTTKPCYEEINNSVSEESSSMLFQKQTDSDSGGSSSFILMDSTLQMMKFCPSSSSSSSTDWNQALLEWSPKSFTRAGDQDFSLEQDPLKSVQISAGFPINSDLYGQTSELLQSYFELDPQPSIQNSLPKEQQSGMHSSKNTHVWNASAAIGLIDNTPGLPAKALEEEHICPTFIAKYDNEEVLDSGSAAKKGSSEPVFKRTRIETPFPLPTFKVRKEKLGDRITALQQLVSPFGKTDTASVLHEANMYIKFLHDQVSVLTTPYIKQQGSQIPQQPETAEQDLKSRGLCLVPISSTFPVANETTAVFWTPTFGGTFR